jgi:hypothetical protein
MRTEQAWAHSSTDTPRLRLSGAVMTHPDRLSAARRLQEALPALDLEIIVDPDPEAGRSSLRTARLAWAAVRPDATHHLVIQDDAIPCRDFTESVLAAVEARPAAAVSLFTEWGSRSSYSVRLAALRGRAWAEVIDNYTPSVGLVLPARLAREFASSAPESARTAKDDVELHAFLAERGVRAWVPVANLIEHAEGRSLTGNELLGPRHSVCFADDVDAAAADSPRNAATVIGSARTRFSVEPMDDGPIPYFDHERAIPVCATRRSTDAGRPKRPISHLLRAHGLDPAAISTSAARALSPLATSTGASRPAVPPSVLVGVWITAFALGIQARAQLPDPPVDPEEILDRPVVRRTLGTLGAGALSLAAPAAISRIAAPLNEIVLQAVREGLQGFEALAGEHR